MTAQLPTIKLWAEKNDTRFTGIYQQLELQQKADLIEKLSQNEFKNQLQLLQQDHELIEALKLIAYKRCKLEPNLAIVAELNIKLQLLNNDEITAAIWTQHQIMINQAENCFYR